MSPRAAAWLAWGLCALTAAGIVAAVILGLLSGPDARPSEGSPISDTFVAGAAAATFAIAGALVAARHHGNPIGWILCVVALGLTLGLLSLEYATYAVLAEPGSLPGGEVMFWLTEWVWLPTMLVGTFLLLLFPHGRLPSRRWRPVAWLASAAMIGVGLHEAFTPGKLDDFPRDNPVGLAGTGGQVAEALAISYPVIGIAVIASVVSLVMRVRRSAGDERQQLKWLASGGAALFVGINLPGNLPVFVGLAVIALAVGVGILKYRLYDIDVVINRALVYGALTAILAGAYLGSVLLLQLALEPLTESSNLAVAGSTLAVAALFRPARRRIQEIVDRRFYRSKYDAARTLESFSTRLRDEIELDRLNAELCAVVQQTMQPAQVSLWLRAPGGTR